MVNVFSSLQFKWVSAGSVLILLAGCGAKVSTPAELKDLAAVNGMVKFKDEPTPGAYVTFHPADSTESRPIASAVVGNDGKFAMKSTVARDMKPGAAPGKYLVTVSWPVPSPTPTDSEATKQKLPAKYQNPKTSGIEITVVSGTNQLEEFALKP